MSLSESEIRQSGKTEINQTLRHLAPSFNAFHPSIAESSDHQPCQPSWPRPRPGCWCSSTASGVQRSGARQRHLRPGYHGVDLNAIPKAAVERIEILRGAGGPVRLRRHENGLLRDAFNMKLARARPRLARASTTPCIHWGWSPALRLRGPVVPQGQGHWVYRLPGSQPERVVFETLPQRLPAPDQPGYRGPFLQRRGACGQGGLGSRFQSDPRGQQLSVETSRTPTTPPWGRPARFPSMPGVSVSVRLRTISIWCAP